MPTFLLTYIIPLIIINAAIFLFLKYFKKQYLTHFYVFLYVEIMYLISNWTNLFGPSLFNHYVHLSDAFLHGRFYLNFEPPYHDVSSFNNHFFISQPPLPSILMMPFVLIYGINFNDIVFTIVIGAINCAILYNILINLNKNVGQEVVPKSLVLLLTSFFAFGTVMWSVTIQGTVWNTAHIVALFFILLAINEILSHKRYFLVGLLAATAIAARPSVFCAFPFFIIIGISDFLSKKEIKKFLVQTLLFLIPYFIWAFLLGLFNYFRYGNFLEFGFSYMNHAEYLKHRLDEFGTLNLHYLAENLNVAFTSFFTIKKTAPYLIPPPEGMSMFVTSPLLIYMFRAFSKGTLKLIIKLDFRTFFQKEYIAIAAITASILTAIPLLLYFNTGWVQFGYRYILDYLPFLIILVAFGMRKKISVLSVILYTISFLVILYGILIYLYFPGVLS